MSNVNVTKLAKLSNLTLDDNESNKFTTQFESTLSTIITLNELDTTAVLATPQVIDSKNIYRDDVIDSSRMFTQNEALLNAKHTHQGYFLVPAVLNET